MLLVVSPTTVKRDREDLCGEVDRRLQLDPFRQVGTDRAEVSVEDLRERVWVVH